MRIQDLAANLAHEGQHGAQNFADGGEVILRDPLSQFHELLRKDRLLVEDGEQRFGFDGRRFVVDAHHNPGQLFIAKRHEHAHAYDGM